MLVPLCRLSKPDRVIELLSPQEPSPRSLVPPPGAGAPLASPQQGVEFGVNNPDNLPVKNTQELLHPGSRPRSDSHRSSPDSAQGKPSMLQPLIVVCGFLPSCLRPCPNFSACIYCDFGPRCAQRGITVVCARLCVHICGFVCRCKGVCIWYILCMVVRKWVCFCLHVCSVLCTLCRYFYMYSFILCLCVCVRPFLCLCLRVPFSMLAMMHFSGSLRIAPTAGAENTGAVPGVSSANESVLGFVVLTALCAVTQQHPRPPTSGRVDQPLHGSTSSS